MTTKTTLEEVNDLYEIAEYMNDPELTVALEFIAKVMFKPDVPIQVVTVELVRLQAIAAKMAMKATWMANVDKSDRAKKNLYYTAAEQIDKVCSSLKYLTKG
jgi:ferritin